MRKAEGGMEGVTGKRRVTGTIVPPFDSVFDSAGIAEKGLFVSVLTSRRTIIPHSALLIPH